MLFLIQKEFKQFFRNKFLPKLMFAFPNYGDFSDALGGKYGDKKCEFKRD